MDIFGNLYTHVFSFAIIIWVHLLLNCKIHLNARCRLKVSYFKILVQIFYEKNNLKSNRSYVLLFTGWFKGDVKANPKPLMIETYFQLQKILKSNRGEGTFHQFLRIILFYLLNFDESVKHKNIMLNPTLLGVLYVIHCTYQ